MSNSGSPYKRISIFLSVDPETIIKYFNSNDPAPLYYRQLSYEFQEYLQSSIACARRYTSVQYKVFCRDQSDTRFFVDPLMRAVRRHFTVKKQLKEQEFRKFKRRNYILLLIAFSIVVLFQGLLPEILQKDHRVHSVFSNSIDVFSWVIMWKPIERLIFYWNPFLKEIALMEKMVSAELIVVKNDKELFDHHMEHFDAA